MEPVRTRRVMLDVLGRFGVADWMRVLGSAALFAGAIAVPTRLVPNGWFRRMTPTRPQDYAFLIVAAILAGLVVGLRHVARRVPERAVVAGGLGTFLAVGCPVCNKVVVALVGVGGATGVFAPMQPVIGLGSLALLVWAAHRAALSAGSEACAVS